MQVPVPVLRPDDIVIPHNPGRHKAPATRHSIRAARAGLPLLPACSAELNPIGRASCRPWTPALKGGWAQRESRPAKERRPA